MDLAYRLTEERDLAECLRILEDRFCYSEELWARLPQVLRQLLADGVLNSAVLEDRDQPAGARLVQFGASVFVTDEFMGAVTAEPRPHLARQVIEVTVAGRSPVLSLPEIRRANSGAGLNLVVLHFGLRVDQFAPEELPAVFTRIPENFFFIHDGFNLKGIVVEFCDPAGIGYSREAGFHLRTDYSEYYQRHQLPIPPPGRHPHRMGITREEAVLAPGTYIGKIFPYCRPQFGFTRGEQQLLLRALQGDTDAEAARALHLSIATVKTRWRAIYERVQARTPQLLPANDPQRETRGGEKRRVLLRYLQQHFAELRPVLCDRANLGSAPTR